MTCSNGTQVTIYNCRCAGINRHEGGDGRAPRRRASDPRWPRVMRCVPWGAWWSV